MRLVAPPTVLGPLVVHLLGGGELERAAIGFLGISPRRGGELLLRDWQGVPSSEYLIQLPYHLEVHPGFWARHAKRARLSGEGLLIAHSHPNSPSRPNFSPSDDAGERVLVPKLRARTDGTVISMVVGTEGIRARMLGESTGKWSPLTVDTDQPIPTDSVGDTSHQKFDRQIRFIGKQGQIRLAASHVTVVGAGGIGSHVVEQLARLGVGRLTVVDPDRVEMSNISRIIGSTKADARVRKQKVHISKRTVRKIGGPSRVKTADSDATRGKVARTLLEADLIVGATDTQFSRSVLNAIAYQYFVPVIDIGVELQAGGASGGRVTWLRPGLPCLWCRGILDPEQVRVEQLDPDSRRLEAGAGYVTGADVPQPSVVTFNGVVASLATTEVLFHLTRHSGNTPPPMLAYRIADGTVRRIGGQPREGCVTCSTSGVLGAGDLADPPWRSGS